jgi:hypothetical protein
LTGSTNGGFIVHMSPASRRALIAMFLLGACAEQPGEVATAPRQAAPAAPSSAHETTPTRAEPVDAIDTRETTPTRAELVDAIHALEQCKERPYVDPPVLKAEPPYVMLLSGREQSIDLLLDAVADTRGTQVTNFFGVRYKVGDLAWDALASMVSGLPLGDERIWKTARAKECGECALWDELARPGGRARLQRQLRAWFDAHRGELEWVEIAGYPPGGRFRIRDGTTR